MSRYFQSLLASIIVVPLSFLVLALVVNPPSWDVTVPRIGAHMPWPSARTV